jgi:hypothetical protein
MGHSKPQVTTEKARMVLSALANVASIHEVQVIGSVAREHKGNDLDVILVVDMYTYISYLKQMVVTHERDYGYDDYADFSTERRTVAFSTISFTPAEYGWVLAAEKLTGIFIDVHVMPEGWQDHVDEIQSHLPHDDAEFVRNIAGDAKRVDTQTGDKGQLEVYNW